MCSVSLSIPRTEKCVRGLRIAVLLLLFLSIAYYVAQEHVQRLLRSETARFEYVETYGGAVLVSVGNCESEWNILIEWRECESEWLLSRYFMQSVISKSENENQNYILNRLWNGTRIVVTVSLQWDILLWNKFLCFANCKSFGEWMRTCESCNGTQHMAGGHSWLTCENCNRIVFGKGPNQLESVFDAGRISSGMFGAIFSIEGGFGSKK